MARSILFGIDLEDIRHRMPEGEVYASEVPRLTRTILDFLDLTKAPATFFAVGRTVEEFPELIQEIVGRGHELACHTYSHIPLTEMDPDEFKRDLERCINAAQAAAGISMTGFRAPFFSLTPASRWVYGVLKEFGFSYSSSILDARWPVPGWLNFERDLKRSKTGDFYEVDGIVEIPISSFKLGPIGFPVGGGIYSRLLPTSVLKVLWALTFRKQKCLSTYIHPYDIDLNPQEFRHPEFQEKWLLNRLMLMGRSSLLGKFESLFDKADSVERFDQYLAKVMSLADAADLARPHVA